ncbi:phosphosulfolactate synthase [Chloroflexota bacterium]
MTGHAFSFLELPILPEKPRKTGLFIGGDFALSPEVQEGVLDTHSGIIDHAKFTDHAGLVSRYPEQWFKRKAELYRRHNVGFFPGGISFEVAMVQDKVEEYFKRLKELGFTGVEVATDVIPAMPPKQREATIGKAKASGLEVFTEIGRKYPDKPLEAGEAIEAIKADLEAGSSKVTIEAAELIVLGDTNPQVMVDVVEAVGLDKVVFECSPPEPCTKAAVWLVKTFGPGVNLENIALRECNRVYAIRQGLIRETGHPYLNKMAGKR